MIYISKELKAEWEAKLAEIERKIQEQESLEFPVDYILGELYGQKEVYEKLLSDAVVTEIHSIYGMEENKIEIKQEVKANKKVEKIENIMVEQILKKSYSILEELKTIDPSIKDIGEVEFSREFFLSDCYRATSFEIYDDDVDVVCNDKCIRDFESYNLDDQESLFYNIMFELDNFLQTYKNEKAES